MIDEVCFSRRFMAPGGPLLRYVLACPRILRKGCLFQSEAQILLGNKGTLLTTIFIVWSHFGTILKKYSPCNGHEKLFMLPFRDKGIILMLNPGLESTKKNPLFLRKSWPKVGFWC